METSETFSNAAAVSEGLHQVRLHLPFPTGSDLRRGFQTVNTQEERLRRLEDVEEEVNALK